MEDEQLEHLIRASGAILGDREVVIIGSQSILPWLKKCAGKPPKKFPVILKYSMEADIIPVDNDENKADEIDGSLGEESMFHRSHGFYAQGVSMSTAKAPKGWLSRCYPLVNQNTWNVIGRCMHPNDLFVAKLLANRPKDHDFLVAMVESDLIRKETILHSLPHVPELTDMEIAMATNRTEALFMEGAAAKENALPNQEVLSILHSNLLEMTRKNEEEIATGGGEGPTEV